MNNKMNSQKGFTLIELLVVISIIGFISSIAVTSLNSARISARDASRKATMRQIQTALEIYFEDNGSYPVTGVAWWGISDNGGNRDTSGANAYIPGLTPNYMTVLPVDPLGITTGFSGYLYRSDTGSTYTFLDHATGPESFPLVGEPFYDFVRPTWALKVCSGATACDD